MDVAIPAAFRADIAGRAPDEPGSPSGEDWLEALPALIDKQLAAWELTPDGPAWHGCCALVLPVRRADGSAAALKLTWPHAEARTEHIALRIWDGHGAVRLLAANPARFALLLERLDGDRDLERVPILEASEALGTLFARLDRPAVPQVPALADQIPRWREKLASRTPAVPRRLLQQAASHLDDLAASLQPARLVHTDLHYMNALAPLPDDRSRGEWLAIDPKPMAAEWAYAIAPAIWNREDEAVRAHSLSAHVRLRADVMADAAGLDDERVRMWTLVRLTLEAVDAAHENATDWGGRMIALASAFMSP